MMGSCHACEVELEDGTPFCACISAIPEEEKFVINLIDDPIW